ncbi:MAG: type II CRISPR RNA-guided endonuclease Cas9 [Eubacterium sp.]|nr:type II CRISPR RNA-guided endonuclease Cas9 [Eubacterium sp.]
MKYGVGLDCGIASVGFCVVALDSNDEPKRIVKLGSRIFDRAENPKDGSSLAKPRREARGLRRRVRRHQHRLERIRYMLVKDGIVSQSELSSMFCGQLSDIYELRTAALDKPISNIEFARVLINLAQRRGFKSNRKIDENTKDKETGKLLGAIERNRESIIERGYRTVGEMLFKDERYSKYKRNKGEDYLNTVSRDMIADEIKKIFDSQRRFGMAFASEEIENEYTDIVMSQRPFDLGPGDGNEKSPSPYSGNQIEKMVGKCTFFPNEYRAAKATYSFQLFSLLQGINNITLTDNAGNTFALSQQERNIIKEYCFNTSNVTYASIRKKLGISSDYKFKNITYTEKGIEESEKKTKFQHLKAYHEMKKVLGNFINTFSHDELDEIGRIFTFYKNDSKIIEQLKNTSIDKSMYDLLLKLPSFSKTGHISTKACKMIIPFLEEGKTYNEACECVGLDFKAHNSSVKQMYLPPKSDELDDIVNPVVRRAVSQTIKVVNAIIREMGSSPTYLNIELARELSKSKKERDEIDKKYQLNKVANEKIEAEIIENFGFKPKGQDILKLKLYHEQDGRCPYSHEPFEYSKLFDIGYVDIDHIIPYSACFDDSYNNKVLTFSTENRQKSNKIPLEYLPESKHSDYRVWVNSTIRNYKKKQNLLKEKFTENDKKEFKSRNLNDTKYLSKVLYNYINDNLLFNDFCDGRVRHVISVNGAVTAYMRKRWGIDKIRENGDLHHGVDAAVIACVTQKMINEISRYSFDRETEFDIDTKTGEVFERFPLPYPNFRKELEARSQITDEKYLKTVLLKFPNYDYDDIESAKPAFVSRMPRHKVTGAAHKDTIRCGKIEGYTISKVPLTSLKLKDGAIDKYYNPESDTLLYNALLQRLIEFEGNAEKAFADEFHKPKSDGTLGPVVKKVKIIERSSSNVPVRNENKFGVADNGSMIRIDVFHIEGDGYYFVPIYVADTVKSTLPNLACAQGKSGWKEMDDKDFVFSLYSNDLIRITAKKDIKFTIVNKDSTLPTNKYGNKMLLYYTGADISTASINGITDDNSYKFRGCGIKSLLNIEKYTVDPLGNVCKVNKEKRMYFK